MALKGIRGATTVDENDREKIWLAAQNLITKLLSMNELRSAQIGAAIFSSTEDLTAGFPSTGVRQLPSLDVVPMFDTREPAVEGSLPLCIRVLLLVDVDNPAKKIFHVYLNGAKILRPDLSKG